MDGDHVETLREDLRRALLHAKDDLPMFQRSISQKDAVIFVGNTRSGKSTLINYAIGTQLVAFRIRKNLYKIEKADASSHGPHIGQGSLSDTTVPGLFPLINQVNAVAVDAPGFADNRGEIQDIVNAIYINQIRSARTCRFVLVSDINDLISDNISGFLNLIGNVSNLVPNFQHLRGAVSLVVTKDNSDYTQNEIAWMLRDKILATHGLNISSESTELIGCFAAREELIGLFRMPSEEGEVGSLDVNLQGSISSTYPLHMDRVPVRFAITPEAQMVLLELYQEFADNLHFDDILKELLTPHRFYFHISDYVYASTDDELMVTKISLNRLRERLFIALNRFLQNVQAILNSVQELVHVDTSSELYKMLTLFVVVDDVGLIQQSFKDLLRRKYRAALNDLMEEVKELINKIDREQKIRKDLDLDFGAKAVMTGASAGLAALGGALLNGFTMRTVATRVVGAMTGVGTVLAVVGAAASVGSYLIKKEEVEKRTEARRRQGRPVAEPDSQALVQYG